MFTVMVPGIDGSDDIHWQSRWQHQLGPAAGRIEPSSWSRPDLDDWLVAIDRSLPEAEPTVLLAHSLGCLAVAGWLARRTPGVVRGVVLIAPPDYRSTRFPADAAPTFVGLDTAALPVPGLIIASDDDPYASRPAVDRLAAGWGVPVVGVGAAGHLNSASGLGDWPLGRALVTAFRAGLGS